MNKTDGHTLLGIDKQILRETSAIVDFIQGHPNELFSGDFI